MFKREDGYYEGQLEQDRMITFDDFKATGLMPIYLEILNYVKRGIVAGTISDGDELPSRRVLSAMLGINPNTVQRAFRELEEEGLISSRSGARSYVSVSSDAIAKIREELLRDEVRAMADKFRQMGITKEEAAELIEKYWEGDDDENEYRTRREISP